MAKKLYEEANIEDIAIAIREKNGTETKYKTSEMGDAVRAISETVKTDNSDTIGTFTYIGSSTVTCSFIKGMTWAEFVESKMNIINNNLCFAISGTEVIFTDDGMEDAGSVSIDGENSVFPSDDIIDGQSYTLLETW